MSREIPEPAELIYSPSPSWAPAQIAVGTALVVAGVILSWPYSAVGLFMIFLGVRSWLALDDDEVSRMRREQDPVTAVIPAQPIRRGE